MAPALRCDKTPFLYSLLMTTILAPKLQHLYSHLTSLPPLLFLLYLPTFLALDVLSAGLFWTVVHLSAPGRAWVLLALARTAVCLTLLGASSVQIAFYIETGGEVKWAAASRLAHDRDGLKVLLSGSIPAFFVAVFIAFVARLITHPLYYGTYNTLCKMLKTFASKRYQARILEKGELIEGELVERGNYAGAALLGEDLEEGQHSDFRHSLEFERTNRVDDSEPSFISRWLNRAIFLGPIITVLILLAVRPRQAPFGHMSNSLPYTLLEIFDTYSEELCGAGSREFPPFPLPDLISQEHWELPNGKFVGWMPTENISRPDQPGREIAPRPTWLPNEAILGFDRWYDPPFHLGRHGGPRPPHPPRPPYPPPPPPPPGHWGHRGGKHFFGGLNYDPVKDPLRISNLEEDILSPIAAALKDRKIKIKHVVLATLESTRKDIFPLKKDSFLHNVITKSYTSDIELAEVNDELSKLTPNAGILTGEASGFEMMDDSDSSAIAGSWRNLTKDRGGINVMGAFTGSTTSLKSLIGSHCGVQPLAVDFTVESHGHIYQPCIPAILQLLNRNKASPANHPRGSETKNVESDNFHTRPWRSVYAQAVTDQYDFQEELSQHMGFSEVIAKRTLMDPASKHYPPTEEQVNYFGYPDAQVKPYLQDMFREAEEKKERIFLSHFTSSTHHPWNTPKAFGETTDFLKRGWWGSEHNLNRYLNVVKYDDWWLGEIMDMLEEFGVAEETLVVMVGDHGLAFREDAAKFNTFENGHISNMRVPLLFHHPSLPRIQLAVNATSLSILPTILDLLATTSSLNSEDSNIATDLMQQYEGQSLIRPYLTTKSGRQAWNIGVLNAGGAVLSVSSAAVPYRLVIPVCKSGVYRFTSNDIDPNEIHPLEEYSIEAIIKKVGKSHGEEAALWVEEAEKVGKWWVLEGRRRWRFEGASLQNDRRPEEMDGAGAVKKEHWWDT